MSSKGILSFAILAVIFTCLPVRADTIKVSFPPFAPLFYYQDGEPRGYCYQTVKAILAGRYEMQIVDMPLNRMFKAIANNQIDMIGCMPCGFKGVNNVTFSETYIQEKIFVFYPLDKPIRDISTESLHKLRGATIRGAITQRYIAQDKQSLLDDSGRLLEFVNLARADFGVLPESMYKIAVSSVDKDVSSNLETRIIDTIEACVAISNKSVLSNEVDYINQWLHRLENGQ